MCSRPRTENLRGGARAALLLLLLMPLGCGGPRVSAPVEARTIEDEPAAQAKAAKRACARRGRARADPASTTRSGRLASRVVYRAQGGYPVRHRAGSRAGLSGTGILERSGRSQPDPRRPEVAPACAARLAAAPGACDEPFSGVAAARVAAGAAPEIEAKPLAPLVVKTGPKAVKLAYSEAALAQLRGEASKPSTAATAPVRRTSSLWPPPNRHRPRPPSRRPQRHLPLLRPASPHLWRPR